MGRLATGARVLAVRSEQEGWGIAVQGPELAAVKGLHPVEIELYDGGTPELRAVGYELVEQVGGAVRATARVEGPGETAFDVEDRWTVGGAVLHLERTVTVIGNAPGGFLSGVRLAADAQLARTDVDLFAPGMIYGGTGNLADAAIGGSAAHRSGTVDIWIREDRLPAPLFGVRFADGSSVAVLNPAPDGATTLADARDTVVIPLVSDRFRFGAVGGQIGGGRVEVGFRFPGTEGETTYQGYYYPGGQLQRWRRRYHPLRDGLVQRYRVDFRFATGEEFPEFYRNAWRWAWSTLRPAVAPQDIVAARRALVDMLADRVEIQGELAGISNFIRIDPDRPPLVARKTRMGFTGKAIESANFLLQAADRDSTFRGARLRRLGSAIIDSYSRLPMSPPAGDGFDLDTGEPTIHADDGVFLRSLADDFKSLMKTIRRERAQGREHPRWLAWATGFGEWLLTQQRPDGGFPRAWEAGTGQVVIASPQSSYNPIPFLVLLAEAANDPRYLEAALRVGEFTWRLGQESGVFVGGTIDNPDVIDKEAGTLSLEAYLALYEATRDRRWLERATRAGDFAETWIYTWNVPMPEGADAGDLHWKPGVSTVGLQLISTGHSLVDAYMAFDVDEYAKLYRYTGDPHYRDVAEILLHNTKGMLALPGRTYDLPGPGWQQEHWSLAPIRGEGRHRSWLPWVSTSHLNGIFGLEEFDPALFGQMARPAPEGGSPRP